MVNGKDLILRIKKAISKDTNKVVSKKVKEEKVPAWFNKEQEVTKTTKEDDEELDKILSELV